MSADSRVSASTSRVGVDFVFGIRPKAALISCSFHRDTNESAIL